MVGVNIMCTRSAGEGSSKLIALLGFISFLFLICFLQLVGALEHDLFLYDLVWVLLLRLRLESSLFVLPLPLCWVLCLMELARVSSKYIDERKKV